MRSVQLAPLWERVPPPWWYRVSLDGKTGFLCNSVEDFINAIARLGNINRRDCCAHVDQNFSVKSMVDG
ncbi:hypothetical protein WA1_37730 [Scytonema hofmannii PCC 7110]|uniref:Uncharacterized protein n=1 Tax=Scytonema hofmannii PCC 7110 TaxID=128403 RepID=A0A139X063_9CYAN|nr:hypothetical protein [Scytonema hofmannii]KYC38095.1 hypothetical protein WA1_37730 [Scytonema hofmannii PCC 7110]